MPEDTWVELFKRQAFPILMRDLQPQTIILFGSRVRDQAQPESDLDVVLVANAFRGVPFVTRAGALLKKIRFPKHLDLLCYSPEEFEKSKGASIVLQDALAHGIVLA